MMRMEYKGVFIEYQEDREEFVSEDADGQADDLRYRTLKGLKLMIDKALKRKFEKIPVLCGRAGIGDYFTKGTITSARKEEGRYHYGRVNFWIVTEDGIRRKRWSTDGVCLDNEKNASGIKKIEMLYTEYRKLMKQIEKELEKLEKPFADGVADSGE